MFCTKCGKQIPDDSVFCTNCGASVSEPAASPEAPAQPAPVAPAPVMQAPAQPVAPAPVVPAQPVQPNVYAAPASSVVYTAPVYNAPVEVDDGYSRRNNHVLMLMAGFFGIFGVHDYIAGRVACGIVKDVLFFLFVTLAGVVEEDTGVGAFLCLAMFAAGMVWTTVDCFRIACGGMTDGRGLRVKKTMWGLSFAIPYAISALIMVLASIGLLL